MDFSADPQGESRESSLVEEKAFCFPAVWLMPASLSTRLGCSAPPSRPAPAPLTVILEFIMQPHKESFS